MSSLQLPRDLSNKITSRHLEELAFIYIRQSTTKQVLYNKESQANQYQLQLRAQALGWPGERIRVIDCDLGKSGRETTQRSGFQELVVEISLGHAGIVFGYEVSRLARNNQDWYHLLDLAAVFGTLIADNDGIYDPRLYNDRLLLGLKGTMSEAELHLLRQRLDAGRMQQVKRGDYRQKLPTGYVRLSDGKVSLDPDDQIRHVLELVFAKFEELGSVNKVVRYLRRNKITLPRRQAYGPCVNQILWKVASEAAVTDMLKNPTYAGVFAHGRRQVDPTLRIPGRNATGLRRKPMTEWLQCLQNAYPAYISWEQYLANLERLQQNGLGFLEKRQQAQGIARNGPGLLQGMVVCGQCGHHMRTVYKHTARYVCIGPARTADVPGTCTSVRSPVVEALVIQAFFEAIQPSALDALDAILAAQHQERQRLDQHWQEQCKRARYEAQLMQRQYDMVDPDNRLVAAELEHRWEASLQHLQQTEEAYHRFQQTPPPEKIPEALRPLFRDLSSRLPDLWPQISNAQRKELLRSLIHHVILKRPQPDQVQVRIVWVSGYYSDHTSLTAIHSEREVSRYEECVARVETLCQQGYNDREMADQLSKEGFHSARSSTMLPRTVQKIRLAHGWIVRFDLLRGADEWENYWTVNGLAKQLGIHESAVYSYIYEQVIPPAFVLREERTGIYLFPKDPMLLELLQKHVAANKKLISSPVPANKV